MHRLFTLASSDHPLAAARELEARALTPDLCVTSPTASARAGAAVACGGRFVTTIEEPLLAARTASESGADVIARLVQALRGVAATEAQMPLIVCDGLDVLGATAFVIDEVGLAKLTDDLERLLPAG
jgi:hypothetical protein